MSAFAKKSMRLLENIHCNLDVHWLERMCQIGHFKNNSICEFERIVQRYRSLPEMNIKTWCSN